jgi:alkylhydroperoxidase family enzyme
MARVDPLPIRGWPPEMREALAAMQPPVARHPRPPTEGRPKGMNVLGTFAHHPALARAWFTTNGHLLMATTLTLRQREIVVLRVATLCKCSYEWAQHVVVGRDVGLTDTEITLVAVGPDAPFLDPLEAALIRAVDELFEDRLISRETWAALAADLDTQQLLDLIFTVGAYHTLALMMRSFELDLDDDLARIVMKEPS